jgi:hypothetical protein
MRVNVKTISIQGQHFQMTAESYDQLNTALQLVGGYDAPRAGQIALEMDTRRLPVYLKAPNRQTLMLEPVQ